MNILLYLFYQLLKGITKLTLWVYYPGAEVQNRERLSFDNPAIVVSNHPNTLLDALNTAARVQKQVFFLANASLFNTPFRNWFFNTFYCIPVERPQDTEGRPVNNTETFARANEFLAGGGCLFIAPEGGSEMERRLRKVKTGTVRIALSAEQAAGFNLNLKIIPVGLNYEAPNRFRSSLFVNVGEPIEVQEFEKAYREDSIQTVRNITGILEDRMRSLIIDTSDDEEDQLVRYMETILNTDRPVSKSEHFYRTKKLIESLRRRKEKAGKEYLLFQEKVNTYFQNLETGNISDRAVDKFRHKANPFSRLDIIPLGLPVFIYGWINNILPAYIPGWVARRLNLYVGYDSTVKAIIGLITFPLFYFLQYKLVQHFGNTQLAWAYLMSVPPAGLFAWEYRKWWKAWTDRFRVRKIHRNDPGRLSTLLNLREEISKSMYALLKSNP